MHHIPLFIVLCWTASSTIAKTPRFGSGISNTDERPDTQRPSSGGTLDLWESLSDFLDPQSLLQPRRFANSAQLLTYTPRPSLDDGSAMFNISVAISGCKHGVRWSTLAGPYTFANGTTKSNTAVGEIIDNLKTFRGHTLDHLDADQAMANHTLTLAQNVAATSNDMLQNCLICKDKDQHSGTEIIHDELRKLLWDRQKIKVQIRELGVLLFASAVAGVLGGLVTGLGAAYNLQPDPPVLPSLGSYFAITSGFAPILDPFNASIADFNEKAIKDRQIQIRNTGIIAGITIFIATLSAGIVTDIMSRRRLQGEQAAAANIFLAQANGALQHIGPLVAAQPALPVQPAVGTPLIMPALPTSSSVSSFPSPSPSSSPPPASGAGCVSAPEAAAFTGSLGALEMAALGSPPPVDLDVLPFNQVQQEMLNEVLVDGVCQVSGGL